MQNTLSDFFEPVENIKYIGSDNYRNVANYLHALNSITKICDMSYYIIDYYKKSFYYVSSNPLFLSGYTKEEVQEMGYDFYTMCIPDEDLRLLLELNIAGFDFFYNLPEKRRGNGYISYDFRLRHKVNRSLIMINHKLTPLLFNDDGNIWMALCLVTLSPRTEAGDVHIFMQDESARYNLDLRLKKFVKVEHKELTKKEIEVLGYVALGHNSTFIAQKLFISESTVKNHKTNIFKKLNAKSGAEAVFYASKRGII